MTVVKACYEVTQQLFQAVQAVKTENRDEAIKEIELLLEKRETFLPSIQPPFSSEDKKLGQEMILMNREIDAKLKLIRSYVQRDINGLNKKKTSMKKYTNPYESVNFDGMFYDKRN
ncbi:flagellar protein FliT [Robertmurraya kyonggiensis]|uniref:Flagellar protein FliT n=1 Tax=Robertmurraya kyonggiensis TaxID=1037680 RepID=A0A4U1D3R7_9BACI|nr:flagellar protein FliT [Robertmurraya kyonggiensis]TKC17045.1 flagellar protein FliT [Robertmurraya kyonggiensis]